MRGKFSIVERLGLPGGDQEQPKVPTIEEDIFGVVKHQGETIAQMQKRIDDEKAAKEADEKATSERNTFVTNYKADRDRFVTTAPDFMDAYNFLLKARADELQAIGYDTPQALHEALTADEYAIVDRAFSLKNPAEMLYGLAKQRGYKPSEAPAGGDKAAEAGKGAEKLATIERGQNANKSLSNTGGSSGDPEMTAEALISMPIDEFEAWCAKNPTKAKRIMGG